MWNPVWVNFSLGNDIMIPKEIQELKSTTCIADCLTWISIGIDFIFSWMHGCWEVVEFHCGVCWQSVNLGVKIHCDSQPRDTCRCLRNIYNYFSYACQLRGKFLLDYVFRLLLCSHVYLWKHKMIGQQIPDQVAKLFPGFGPRFDNPPAVASCLHVLKGTHHQPYSQMRKEVRLRRAETRVQCCSEK